VEQPLGLGELSSNRFTLAIRRLQLPEGEGERQLAAACDGLSEHGYVNYFGLQRFGTSKVICEGTRICCGALWPPRCHLPCYIAVL